MISDTERFPASQRKQPPCRHQMSVCTQTRQRQQSLSTAAVLGRVSHFRVLASEDWLVTRGVISTSSAVVELLMPSHEGKPGRRFAITGLSWKGSRDGSVREVSNLPAEFGPWKRHHR